MPLFLDCEASSLSHESYPVEIAWSDEDENIETHLINVSEYPVCYTDWSKTAEKIHGLSQSYLKENGESPIVVANRLNEILLEKKMYSDNPDYDAFWCDRLFEAVNLKIKFEFKNIDYLIKEFLPIDYGYINYLTGDNRIDELKYKARVECGLEAHRAANDVAYFIKLYHLARQVGGYYVSLRI